MDAPPSSGGSGRPSRAGKRKVDYSVLAGQRSPPPGSDSDSGGDVAADGSGRTAKSGRHVQLSSKLIELPPAAVAAASGAGSGGAALLLAGGRPPSGSLNLSRGVSPPTGLGGGSGVMGGGGVFGGGAIGGLGSGDPLFGRVGRGALPQTRDSHGRFAPSEKRARLLHEAQRPGSSCALDMLAEVVEDEDGDEGAYPPHQHASVAEAAGAARGGAGSRAGFHPGQGGRRPPSSARGYGEEEEGYGEGYYGAGGGGGRRGGGGGGGRSRPSGRGGGGGEYWRAGDYDDDVAGEEQEGSPPAWRAVRRKRTVYLNQGGGTRAPTGRGGAHGNGSGAGGGGWGWEEAEDGRYHTQNGGGRGGGQYQYHHPEGDEQQSSRTQYEDGRVEGVGGEGGEDGEEPVVQEETLTGALMRLGATLRNDSDAMNRKRTRLPEGVRSRYSALVRGLRNVVHDFWTEVNGGYDSILASAEDLPAAHNVAKDFKRESQQWRSELAPDDAGEGHGGPGTQRRARVQVPPAPQQTLREMLLQAIVDQQSDQQLGSPAAAGLPGPGASSLQAALREQAQQAAAAAQQQQQQTATQQQTAQQQQDNMLMMMQIVAAASQQQHGGGSGAAENPASAAQAMQPTMQQQQQLADTRLRLGAQQGGGNSQQQQHMAAALQHMLRQQQQQHQAAMAAAVAAAGGSPAAALQQQQHMMMQRDSRTGMPMGTSLGAMHHHQQAAAMASGQQQYAAAARLASPPAAAPLQAAGTAGATPVAAAAAATTQAEMLSLVRGLHQHQQGASMGVSAAGHVGINHHAAAPAVPVAVLEPLHRQTQAAGGAAQQQQQPAQILERERQLLASLMGARPAGR